MYEQNQFVSEYELINNYFEQLRQNCVPESRKISSAQTNIIQQKCCRIVEQETHMFPEQQYEFKSVNDKACSQQLNSEQNGRKLKLQIRKKRVLQPRTKIMSQMEENVAKQQSQRQHKHFILKVKREKLDLLNAVKQRQIKQTQRNKRKLRLLTDLNQKNKIELLERKKNQIKQHLQQLKQSHSLFLAKESRSRQMINKIKRSRPLYQVFQEKYQISVVKPQQQKRSQYLKQKKQQNKLDFQAIIQHQKKYMSLRQQSKSQKKQKSIQKYQPPPRSKKYSIILQEQEKKRRAAVSIEKQKVRQKMQRLTDYTDLLDQEYRPKLRSKIEAEQIKMPEVVVKNQIDKQVRVDLGNRYLQQAKRSAGKRARTEPKIQNESEGKRKNTQTLSFVPASQKGSYITQKRHQQIQKLLSCNVESKRQRLQCLQMANQKLNNELKRYDKQSTVEAKIDNQQIIDLLINTIKAKITFLNQETS